jgi:hypothetical protein
MCHSWRSSVPYNSVDSFSGYPASATAYGISAELANAKSADYFQQGNGSYPAASTQRREFKS